MGSLGPGRVRFSGFQLDLRSGELWRDDGSRLVLPNQPFRILATLVRAPGELISREQLRRELWPDDTFVDFEHSLNAAMKRLREILGDSATSPRLIETIPRHGYRFIAVASAVQQSGSATVPRGRWTWRATSVALAVVVIAAAAASGWMLSGTPDSESSVFRPLVRLTSTSGVNIDPALSPDGSLVAYASDRGGSNGLDIWIQPVAGGPPRQLTNDPGDDVEPSFSSDGAFVAYARRETGGVYRVGVLGDEPRLIAEAARARTPKVSPDGRWVVFWSGSPVWNLSARGAGAGGTLLMVAATGGSVRELMDSPLSARNAVWSPDGDRVLFLGGGQDERPLDWYLIARGGGTPSQTGALEVLREAGVPGVPVPGDWTRTDNVIFSTAAADGSNVWQVPVSANTGSPVGPPVRLTFGTALERSPTSSGSGRIAFTSVGENVDVWRVPLHRTSGIALGAFERVTDAAGPDTMLNVDDTGARMIFLSSRSGRREVWLKDFATGQESQLTFTGATYGRLGRDGAQVATSPPGPNRAIELLSVDRPTFVQTAVCRDCEVDDWSPDGSQVVVEQGTPARLIVREIATGRDRLLAIHPSWNLYQGRFSPDGRWVAFHTTNSPTLRQVYIVSASDSGAVPTGQWKPVVTDFGIQPSWSDDGSAVYYFSSRDGAFCAWLQRVDPKSGATVGQPVAVQHLHEPRLRAGTGAAVTNDVQGRYLYATLTQTTGNIWMLDLDRRAE